MLVHQSVNILKPISWLLSQWNRGTAYALQGLRPASLMALLTHIPSQALVSWLAASSTPWQYVSLFVCWIMLGVHLQYHAFV